MILKSYIPVKLRGIVDMIWEQRSDTPTGWKILPSGKVELLFRLGPVVRMHEAKKIGEHNSPLPHFCFLSGLHTRPLSMSFERFHMMGVQMNPIAVRALFGIPGCEIRDYYIEGDALMKNLDQIENELNARPRFIEKAKWLENFLLSKICETAELHTAINLSKVTDEISCNNFFRKITAVEQYLGYSRTQTWRIFTEWFGLSSSPYQRLLQFVHAVNHLHSSPEKLTMIGLNQGYFDQAHFIRSFNEFAEMTPGQYRKLMTHIRGQLPF
jgi:AraC-like DNA-binding protein